MSLYDQIPSNAGPRDEVSLVQAATTLTNIAAAVTDSFSTLRVTKDLRPFKFVRLSWNVTTQAANGGTAYLQYSTDNGSTFTAIDATSGAVSLVGTGLKHSAWVALPAAAQVESAVLRLATVGGDGAEDPVVNSVYAEFAA